MTGVVALIWGRLLDDDERCRARCPVDMAEAPLPTPKRVLWMCERGHQYPLQGAEGNLKRVINGTVKASSPRLSIDCLMHDSGR